MGYNNLFRSCSYMTSNANNFFFTISLPNTEPDIKEWKLYKETTVKYINMHIY